MAVVSSSINHPASSLIHRYLDVRRFTESLCEGLATEDFVVQSMADVSPTKWHLAHTSWFFETFILREHKADYEPLDETYAYLFNSYYVQAGERHCRAQRGYISRPTVAQVFDYRKHVDENLTDLLDGADEETLRVLTPLIEIGLNHEQQHQELMVTDLKHVFSVNPLRPVFREASHPELAQPAVPLEWLSFEGGLHAIGHEGAGFSYDNEAPRHRRFVEPFRLANRLVTCGEYLQFMEDGGYGRAELWLSAGWAEAQANQWSEPFYWERREEAWWAFTLSGMRRIDPDEPVCHLSYFEADAYARWAGARLPREDEWEIATQNLPLTGNFAETGIFHPRPAMAGQTGLLQAFGDVWEWTQSQYTAYPGYHPPAGALGEYNGKFMCNQFVLRGGSCATSQTHIRHTYRNFFPPEATWQFTGVRLASDQESGS
ncbi:ergothioneine biosynthesis protein EgtB [soil metagenome]